LKKNLNKWLIVFMTLATLAIVLAACGTSNNGNGNTDTNTNTNTNTNAGDSNTGGGSDPDVLTAFSSQGARIISFNENSMTQRIEDELDIDLEFQTAPEDGAKNKQNLILASGDYPDAFIGGDFSKVEQLKYGTLGTFVPLNDLIKEYGPNIQKVFDENPQFEDGVTAPDGNIYSLPGYDGCWHCFWPAKSWMNVEWLETLGLELPTTTEEFENVLLAFKNDDPNGNGKADEIPLSGWTSATGNWGNPIYYIMNAFTYTDPNNFLKVNDGEVDLVADNVEWNEGLKYIKSLYDQGLIDPNTFTQNQDSLQQLAMNPGEIILGNYYNLWNGDIVTIYGEAVDQRWNQYRAVPPLEGPDGVRYATYTGQKLPAGKFAITDKASKEDQIAAIKVANYLYSKQGALDAFVGAGTWADADEGQLGTNGEQALYKKLDVNDNWDAPTSDIWENGFYYMSVDLFNGRNANQDLNIQAGNERRLYLDNLKYADFAPSNDVLLPDLFIDPDKAQQVAEMVTVINSYIKQNAVQFVIGQKNLDSDWDAYVQGLADLDVEKYLGIYQEAYELNVN
jgi:putative aldouronate transport system substrate-binding protein